MCKYVEHEKVSILFSHFSEYAQVVMRCSKKFYRYVCTWYIGLAHHIHAGELKNICGGEEKRKKLQAKKRGEKRWTFAGPRARLQGNRHNRVIIILFADNNTPGMSNLTHFYEWTYVGRQRKVELTAL